jgi:hypothetical protein
MTDPIKYHLTMLEVTGKLDDTDSAAYIRQLAAILACDQSCGYTKKWARSWLDEIKHQQELVSRLRRIPVAVA